MTQQWQRDGRILYLLNDQGGRRFNVTVDPGWPNPEDAWAMAESILRAVNAHEALIANSHAIVALTGGWDEQGATGPRAPLSWETVARMAIDYARAALINAYDLPSDTTPDQLRQVQSGVLVWRGDYWEMPPKGGDKP